MRGGGSAGIAQGVIEFAAGRWARRLHFRAITFGHVVIGVDHAALDSCRAHEQVHVRQYERWGLLFFPLYLGSSLWQLLRGRRPYRDNYFERQAYDACAKASPQPRPNDVSSAFLSGTPPASCRPSGERRDRTY